MFNRLYPRLAATNLKKNKKFYLPYLFACIGMVMMFYIILTLRRDPALASMSGGADVKLSLSFGCIIMAIFSVIILFYTNSVLTKHRKKEFGLYNILGMEKRHIGRVLFLENLYTAIIAYAGGIAGGIVFSKLMQLLLMKLLGNEIKFGLSIDGYAIGFTIVLFAIIFFIIYLNTVRIIKMSNPIELLHGSNQGEKEPKSKWILALLGVASLAGGYILSLKSDSAYYAILVFFLAVLLVIIGTYLLFTASSIVFLKMLKKNKRYYYKTNHFATVSGMLYRMKRNATGLASICILSTMVLVTASTTICLYVGGDDIINQRYPYDVEMNYNHFFVEEEHNEINEKINTTLSENKLEKLDYKSYDYLLFAGLRDGGNIIVSKEDSANGFTSDLTKKLVMVYCITADSYEKVTGTHLDMNANEIYCCQEKDAAGDNLNMMNYSFKVNKLDEFPLKSGYENSGYSSCYIVVKDMSVMQGLEAAETAEYEEDASCIKSTISFNLSGSNDEKYKFAKELSDITATSVEGEEYKIGHVESKQITKEEDYFACFGAFFFLGMFLGVMFILATVLIIYYKQLSEGYDDCKRFAIMQQVGMTKKEVRSTIRTQILIVFFLPLVTAAIHVAFAFPIIKYILAAFEMFNTALFIKCIVGSFVVFALLYVLVYTLTAKVYYGIVSKGNNN